MKGLCIRVRGGVGQHSPSLKFFKCQLYSGEVKLFCSLSPIKCHFLNKFDIKGVHFGTLSYGL